MQEQPLEIRHTSEANRRRISLLPIVIIVMAGVVFVWLWNDYEESKRRELAQAACERWADKLDKQTTPTGAYIQADDETLPETHPWGNPLHVYYTAGGLGESLEVRSLGGDGIAHTGDDCVAVRWTVTLAGVGRGIRDGVEDVSERGGRGLARGIVQGLAQEIHKRLSPDDSGDAPADVTTAPSDTTTNP